MEEHYRVEALKEWDQARRKAFWSQLSAALRGRDIQSIDFNMLSHRLRLKNATYQGLQTIPLDKIVGSEDRYEDFSRAFLPLNQELQERWAHIATLYLDPMSGGVPPIEVYQVGGVYFVKDGNHRVSVARQLQIDHLEAYVWEFNLPGMAGETGSDLDALLLEAQRYDFLEQTHLDELRPGHMIRLTDLGGYIDLFRQLAHYQDAMRQTQGTHILYQQAVEAWYDSVYQPTVQIIREAGVLELFPGRTETDLFVWVTRYQHQLDHRYNSPLAVKELVADFKTEAARPRLVRLWHALLRRLLFRPA